MSSKSIYLFLLIVLYNNVIAQSKKKQIENLNDLNKVLIENNKLKRSQDSTIISNLNTQISQNHNALNKLTLENNLLDQENRNLKQNIQNLNMALNVKQDSINNLKKYLSDVTGERNTNKFEEPKFDGYVFSISVNNVNDISWISNLFGANYNKNTSEFEWLPDLSEQIEFNIEPGKKLFTIIDTIFYHGKNKENFTIALSTYKKNQNDERENECHACGQVLSLVSCKLNSEKTHYEIFYFQKYIAEHGSWGERPEYSLIEINDDINYILVSEGYSNRGESSEWKTLYHKGKEALYFESSFDGEDNNGEKSTNTELMLDKNKMVISLNTIENYKTSNGKMIKQSKIVKYKVDPMGRIIKQ